MHLCIGAKGGATGSFCKATTDRPMAILHELTHYGGATDRVKADPFNAHALEQLLPIHQQILRQINLQGTRG